METKTNSFNDAEKKVLELIKGKLKKRFLKYCRINWGFGMVFTHSSTVGWQSLFRKMAVGGLPTEADNCLVVGRAISIKVLHDSRWGMGEVEQSQFIYKVYELFRERIEKKTNPVWDLRTDVYIELFGREFFLPEDLPNKKAFWVECFGLYYKQPIYNLREAIQLANKVAIPNKYSIVWRSVK